VHDIVDARSRGSVSVFPDGVCLRYLFGIFSSRFGFRISNSKYRDIGIGFRFFAALGPAAIGLSTLHINSFLLIWCISKCTAYNLAHVHCLHVSTKHYGRGRFDFFHYLTTINLETFQRIFITKVTCTDNFTF